MTEDYKWKQRGKSRDRLPPRVASCELECHLLWMISRCAPLMPPEMSLLNHCWGSQAQSEMTDSNTITREQLFFFYHSLFYILKSSRGRWKPLSSVRSFWELLVPQLYVCSTVESRYHKARWIKYVVCRWHKNSLCRCLIRERVPRKTKHYLNRQNHPGAVRHWLANGKRRGPACGVTTASPQLKGGSPWNQGCHAKLHHGGGASTHLCMQMSTVVQDVGYNSNHTLEKILETFYNICPSMQSFSLNIQKVKVLPW